jgi:hypothetical protein
MADEMKGVASFYAGSAVRRAGARGNRRDAL